MLSGLLSIALAVHPPSSTPRMRRVDSRLDGRIKSSHRSKHRQVISPDSYPDVQDGVYVKGGCSRPCLRGIQFGRRILITVIWLKLKVHNNLDRVGRHCISRGLTKDYRFAGSSSDRIGRRYPNDPRERLELLYQETEAVEVSRREHCRNTAKSADSPSRRTGHGR